MVENILENVWNGIINAKYETHFQPQYHIATGEVIGLEALARLKNPDGLVSPGKFISVLEDNRMINKLDLFIFESVCKFIIRCKENNASVVPVSVNLSRYDFFDPDFINKLDTIRKNYNVDPKLINIEINDTLPLESKLKTRGVIRAFHELGYSVALDNYYGRRISLDYVKGLYFGVVKVDMGRLNNELIRNEGKGIALLLETARRLDITIIAESVETSAQVEFLKQHGCEFVQGYYYAKPMSEELAFNLLAKVEVDSATVLLQQKLIEAESYKKRFYNLLGQTDIFYCEYVVATREMYPCERSVRELGLSPVMYNGPRAVIDAGIVGRDSEEVFYDLFRQIDAGTKHVEAEVAFTFSKKPYIIRCDVEFDGFGKPVSAFCSAVRVIK